MKKRILIVCVLCFGASFLLVNQVSAGCCCSPRFCAAWLKGSTENQAKILVKNVKECLTDEYEGNCGIHEIAGLGPYLLMNKKKCSA